MDNPRLFLWIGLALLAWMNIIQWDRDYGAQSAATTATTTSSVTPTTAAPAAPGTAACSDGKLDGVLLAGAVTVDVVLGVAGADVAATDCAP